MKKEVLCNLVRVVLFVVLLCLVLPFSFAGFPGAGGVTPVGTDALSVGSSPRDSGKAKGYWVAEDEQAYAYPGVNPYYEPITGTEPKHLFEGAYLPSIYEYIVIPLLDDGTPWSMNFNEIYTRFRIPEGHEARRVRFVLDPESFNVGTSAEPILLASHGGETTFAWYQGESDADCVVCSNADDPDSCSPELPTDVTCIISNILNRDDCSAMSDFNQQFCEGVVGIAPNIDIPIGNVGTAGYGGCRLYGSDDIDANIARQFGRDWLTKTTETITRESAFSFYSPDFLPAGTPAEQGIIGSTGGACCGNDLGKDPGVLARDIGFPNDPKFESRFICLNSTNKSVTGDFLWLDARGTENFKIYYIQNREGVKAPYAAISNSDDWFICNTDNRDDSLNLDSTYKPLARNPTGTRREGVLLNEYEILPLPWEQFGEGTTPLPGGPSLGDGSTGSYGGDTGRGRSSPHSDSVDEDSFVSDIDETSLRGVGRITACDKDGDGYDGNWSADSIAVSWHDTTEDVCENPQPPFDCDEGNIIDGHYPDETSISRSTFARMRHPGRIDYCIDGVDYDLDCNSATTCIEEEGPTQTSEEFFANPDAFMSYPRFMCSNVDESGDFAECCGWSLGFCFNSQQGRRTGSPIHTLRDFSNFEGGHIISPDEAADRQTMNYVLRYGINLPPESAVGVDEAAYYTLALQSEANELKITNWTHYKTLDFYIWFTTNFEVELWLGKTNPGMTPGYPDSYTYPYKLRIVDYVVNEAELNKWLHVSIPIDDITMTGFTPDVMVLASNVLRLIRLGTSVDVTVYDERKTFSNVIGVDKIHFRPKTEQLLDRAKDENYFCTGTWPATWVSDLDQNTPIPGIPDTDHPGRDACEAIPSYGWTGSKCCGDDTGDDTDSDTIGPATQKEFYADTNAGCWAGNVIANGSRVMLVKYNLSYAGIANREVTRSCRNETCIYDLPPVMNALVTNGNPEVYDLYIVNGVPKFVGRGALTPNDNSYLRASSVPMQVLFADGAFWSCNAAKFVNVSLNALIPISNRITSTGETCSIKAGFFCDHIDGANSGWNGEGLIRYPGTNITLADGTQKDLGEGSTVAAEYRESTKRNYNLIRNGGFENV